jgi:hypothetical protein
MGTFEYSGLGRLDINEDGYEVVVCKDGQTISLSDLISRAGGKAEWEQDCCSPKAMDCHYTKTGNLPDVGIRRFKIFVEVGQVADHEVERFLKERYGWEKEGAAERYALLKQEWESSTGETAFF